ncbi:MAG: nucleoside triphosphate pyrophosphohydrolase [Gemmatimonadales bacterium]
MQDKSALGRALAMVRDLRKRCPWDRAQTRETLRPYLVEEALELDEALGGGDIDSIRAELSDLLLHLAFQMVIAEEDGQFTPADVAEILEAKMRRRHPHLFDLGAAEPWERLKRRERKGTLTGIVPTLPPLLKAQRLQERAASVGFDWPDVKGPIAKVREELEEVEAELTPGVAPSTALAGEIGDLLFAAVNLARKAGIDPTLALDGANRKFRERFEGVERLAAQRGVDIETAGLEALDGLWNEVKVMGTAGESAAGRRSPP